MLRGQDPLIGRRRIGQGTQVFLYWTLFSLFVLSSLPSCGLKQTMPDAGAETAAPVERRLTAQLEQCSDLDLGVLVERLNNQACMGPWYYVRYKNPCYAVSQSPLCGEKGRKQSVWCRSPFFDNGVIDEATKVDSTTRQTKSCKRVCGNVRHCPSSEDVENCLQECRENIDRPCPDCSNSKCTVKWECKDECFIPNCDAEARRLTRECEEQPSIACWVDSVQKGSNDEWCEVTQWTAKYKKDKETSDQCTRDPSKVTETEIKDEGPIYNACRNKDAGLERTPEVCEIEDVTIRFTTAEKTITVNELLQLDPTAQVFVAAPKNPITPSQLNSSLLAVCTTCDDIDANSPQSVAKKFECLTRKLPAGAPTGTEHQRRAQLKLLLERRAHWLSEGQRNAILSLYAGYPGDVPACGASWNGQEPGAKEITGTLQLCYRLGASHEQTPVQAQSAQTLAPVCIDTVTKAKALSEAETVKRESVLASIGVMTSALSWLPKKTPQTQEERQTVLRHDLRLVSAWYAAVKDGPWGENGARQELLQAVNTVAAALWSGLNKGTIDGLDQALKQKPDTAFSEYIGEAAALDRELLDALFSPDTEGAPPLNSAPLVEFIAQALDRFDRRIQQVTVHHDLACRLLNCFGRNTELALVQRVLASLLDRSALALALAEVSQIEASGAVKFHDEWGKWHRTFERILAQHEALETAILEASGIPAGQPYRPDLLFQAPESTMPPPLRKLTGILQGVQARVKQYAKTGQFTTISGIDEVVVGLREAKREAIVASVREATERLLRAKESYRNDFERLVQARMTEARGAGTSNAASARGKQLIDEIQGIVGDMQGLGVTAEQDMARFSDFTTRYLEAMRAVENTAPMQVENKLPSFPIPTSGARYSGSQSNSLTSAYRQGSSSPPWKVVRANAGDVVMLTVTGTWSPTCAMQEMDDIGGFKFKEAAQLAPQTSSQGYSSQFTTGEFTAHSHQRTWDTKTAASINACINTGTGLNWPVVWQIKAGVSLDTCVSASTGYTWARSNSWGDESRTSASFINGMRLPNTPFPDFPVGSLLAVLAKPNTDEILDVQVILPERFTIVFQETAELYFVVNDRSCSQTRGQLNVELVHMKPATEAMRQLGEAMKSLRDAIRQEGDNLAFQGRLLPSQTAQFRAMAWQKLSEACRCETESYPSAVRGFYSLWIETEVARVERQVEILALQRRTRQLLAELESIAVEVESEQRQARMGSRLAVLALNSLDLDLLQGDSISLTRRIQSRLMPFIELRYPEAVSGPDGILNVKQDRSKLEGLTELDWTTPMIDYIDDVGKVTQTIVDRLEMAAETAPEVGSWEQVVAFRNPYADPPATGELPSSLKWIDDARAHDIWNSIRRGERIFLELRPEDIYGRPPVSMDCTLVTPIITAVALYVGREGEPANDALNEGEWRAKMRAETRMVFPSVHGQRVLHFANADWLRKPVRFLYGLESRPLAVFHEIIQKEGRPFDASLVGISPFTRFVIEDFTFTDSNNNHINLANPIKGADGKPDATSLMLILQLEVRSDSLEVKGVRTCLP